MTIDEKIRVEKLQYTMILSSRKTDKYGETLQVKKYYLLIKVELYSKLYLLILF